MQEIDFTFRAGEALLLPLTLESEGVVIDQNTSHVQFRLSPKVRPHIILIEKTCDWDGVDTDGNAIATVSFVSTETQVLCPDIYKLEFRYYDALSTAQTVFVGYCQVLPSLFQGV